MLGSGADVEPQIVGRDRQLAWHRSLATRFEFLLLRTRHLLGCCFPFISQLSFSQLS